jgi:hypothetical protein
VTVRDEGRHVVVGSRGGLRGVGGGLRAQEGWEREEVARAGRAG